MAIVNLEVIALEYKLMAISNIETQIYNAKISSGQERLARIRAIKGKYIHLRTSSEEFAKRKQEELKIEEKQP